MARKNHGIEMLHSKRRCHEEEKTGGYMWEVGKEVQMFAMSNGCL